MASPSTSTMQAFPSRRRNPYPRTSYNREGGPGPAVGLDCAANERRACLPVAVEQHTVQLHTMRNGTATQEFGAAEKINRVGRSACEHTSCPFQSTVVLERGAPYGVLELPKLQCSATISTLKNRPSSNSCCRRLAATMRTAMQGQPLPAARFRSILDPGAPHARLSRRLTSRHRFRVVW